MLPRVFTVVAIWGALWLASASVAQEKTDNLPAADLTKIDRTIVKEPVYRSKSPRYCLLVFGASAKTRVWLVLDDDVLYVDPTGRGNLAGDAKRISPTAFKEVVQSVRQENPPTERDYLIGDVVEIDSKTKHTDLRIMHYRYDALKTVLYCVYVQVKGKFEQTAVIAFADRPEKAPIIHLNGPLTMGFYGEKPELAAGAESKLSFCVGIQGLGAFTVLDYKPIPASLLPVAEIEFPVKNSEKRIGAKVLIDHRC
jgi:hypothetical protein